jgi:hypothetical protein
MADNDNPKGAENLPTLDDIFIAFQKSMARLAQDTARAAQNDPLFLYGQRELFRIDDLDVDLVIGLQPDRERVLGKERFHRFRAISDLSQFPKSLEGMPGVARLKFRVKGRTLEEQLNKPFLFLRISDRSESAVTIEIQALDAKGSPSPCKDLTLEILPDALPQDIPFKKKFQSDEQGTLRIVLELRERRVFLKHPAKTNLKSIEIPKAEYYLIRAEGKIETRVESGKPEWPKVFCYRPLVVPVTVD